MLGDGAVAQSNDHLVTMEVDDGVDEEELLMRDLPPLSEYVTSIKFWCSFSIFPVTYLILNIVAISTWLEFDKYRFRYFRINPYTGENSDLLLDMFKANSFACAWILLVDTAVLVQATRMLEKQVTLLNADEDTVEDYFLETSNDDSSFVHAKVSRKLDKFFGLRQRPRHTTMVCLLYVCTIIIGASCLASFGISYFAASSTAADHCSYKARRRSKKTSIDQSNIEGIPEDLQTWAKAVSRRDPNMWSRWSRNKVSFSYVHMTDGRTFFVGMDPNSEKKEPPVNLDGDDSFGNAQTETLISVGMGKGNTAQVYPNIVYPHGFTSVSGASIGEAETFCCVYNTPYPTQVITEDISDTRLLCFSSNEDISNGFRNTSLSPLTKRRKNRWVDMGELETIGHEGILWLVTPWIYERSRSWENEYEKYDSVVEYYSIEPVSMTIKSIANVTYPQQRDNMVIYEFGSGGPCMHWIAGVLYVLLMITISPFCYWLIKKKKMNVGVAPLTLATCFLLAAVNESIGSYVCFAVTIATSILLLRGTRTWRDVILYIHYSIILFFLVKFLFGAWMDVLFLILGVVVGVFLNHPILEIMGWIGGPVYVIFLSMDILRNDDHYYYPHWIFESIIWFSIAVVVSCGLVSTGRALRKYRAYVSYYGRRLWASIRSLETSSSRQSGDGDNLARRLID